MCRFTLYQGVPVSLGALLTEPTHSLINQSFASTEGAEPLNGDGFGVAWYAEGVAEPARFRSISPAWSNANLLELGRVVTSRCVLAHVRAATQALAVAEANCHPFKHGPWTFMHNGDIEGFGPIRRRLLGSLSDAAFEVVRGTTDSEHLFAVLLDAMGAASGAPAAGIAADPELGATAAMADAFVAALARVRAFLAETGDHEVFVNAVLCNGDDAVVCRYAVPDPDAASSLYLNQGRRYVCEGGVCRMVDPDRDTATVVVSSEPLSSDPGWHTVPTNSLVLLRQGRVVGRRELTA